MKREVSPSRRQRGGIAGRVFARMAGVLALALLLALGVAACGLSGTGGADSAAPTATAIGGNCGAVATGPRPVQNTPSAVSVEQCFAAAHTHCQPATLLFTAGGLDTITTHALAVVPSPGSGCHIADTRQTTLAGSGNKGPTTVLTCTTATLESDGLHLSGCQNSEDFTVAGTSAPPSPTASPTPAN